MATVEIGGGEVNDLGQEVREGPAGQWPGGGGLVLPEEVVADLAGQLVARARAGEPVRLTGRDGLLAGVIGQVLQAGLALELDEHLQAGGGVNGRNGYSAKTLKTEAGPVAVSVPRDRAGTFEPLLVPKRAGRVAGGLDDMIISLYAHGMSVRDILHHLEQVYGTQLSHETVSRITDGVLEEVRA